MKNSKSLLFCPGEKSELELLVEILNEHKKGMLINNLKTEQMKVLSISRNDPQLLRVIKELNEGQEVNETMLRCIARRIKEIMEKKGKEIN